jgi:type VI secretion system protein ImpL
VTFDGRQLSFFNEPGRFGLEKMINSAQRRRIDGQVFELKWPQAEVAVAVQLRILSNSAPASQPAPATEPGAKPGALPALVAGSDEASPAALVVPTVPLVQPTAAMSVAPVPATAPARQVEVVAKGEGA